MLDDLGRMPEEVYIWHHKTPVAIECRNGEFMITKTDRVTMNINEKFEMICEQIRRRVDHLMTNGDFSEIKECIELRVDELRFQWGYADDDKTRDNLIGEVSSLDRDLYRILRSFS